jgi:hypothetical protein
VKTGTQKVLTIGKYWIPASQGMTKISLEDFYGIIIIH